MFGVWGWRDERVSGRVRARAWRDEGFQGSGPGGRV